MINRLCNAGDNGSTSPADGTRVEKDSTSIHAICEAAPF